MLREFERPHWCDKWYDSDLPGEKTCECSACIRHRFPWGGLARGETVALSVDVPAGMMRAIKAVLADHLTPYETPDEGLRAGLRKILSEALPNWEEAFYLKNN